MKTWKNWPYWLKGGTIGGGITAGSILALFLCDFLSSGGMVCDAFVFFGPLALFAILAEYGFPPYSWSNFAAFLTIIAISFVAGAFVGLVVTIYNKIKTRYQ